eukprot:scaffold376855_cov19-Prasinocladus_malaysianus.AAC.1
MVRYRYGTRCRVGPGVAMKEHYGTVRYPVPRPMCYPSRQSCNLSGNTVPGSACHGSQAYE